MGRVCTGGKVLFFGEAHKSWDSAYYQEKREMVTYVIRNVEEEKRIARVVGMKSE